ncbi:MAG TPA: nitroreductase family protein [Nitrososphaerales archaeon]|nr:nitroreductase family protein [Nitrososphaerales archaeon]
MNAAKAVRTKLDVREFSDKPVPNPIKLSVLEAGRLTQSGINSQHWRFILVQERQGLARLARDSTSGSWVAGANFAVVICTDPAKGFHLLDAGRAVQDMQLTAWDFGVASGIYTGIREEALKKDLGIPEKLEPTAVVAFGFPTRPLKGRKKRRPLKEVAFLERYGGALDPLGTVQKD